MEHDVLRPNPGLTKAFAKALGESTMAFLKHAIGDKLLH